MSDTLSIEEILEMLDIIIESLEQLDSSDDAYVAIEYAYQLKEELQQSISED